MKKDNLATLHHYANKYLLSNIHKNISNVLNIKEKSTFFEKYYE